MTPAPNNTDRITATTMAELILPLQLQRVRDLCAAIGDNGGVDYKQVTRQFFGNWHVTTETLTQRAADDLIHYLERWQGTAR